MLAPWLWLLLAFALLIPLERWIHRRLQGVWLILFNSPDIALILYSLILLPGVFVHEGSHWLMATLLGVRTGHFSVTPERMPDDTLRLGYVETQRVDFVREALIGLAPLLAGSAVVTWIGLAQLNVGAAGEALALGDLLGFLQTLQAVFQSNDAWAWLYLLFAVSNSMLPSASDRRAWPGVIALMLALGGVLAFIGFGPAVAQALAAPVEAVMRGLAVAFTITVGLDVACLPFLAMLEWMLVRLTGRQVHYS